jgi:uncharacterized protein
MTTLQLLLVAATVAIAACVQGTVGIGFALIVAPVLAFLQPELLPVSLLWLMLPLNLFTVLREHQAFDWTGGAWITLGRALGTLAGAGVLAALPGHALNLLIGAANIAEVLRSTVAGCFLLGELLSIGVLGAIGRMTSQQMLSAALLLPFLAIGGLVSSFLRHGLNGRLLRSLVLIFAVTSGAILIIRG